jgi:hypothetical protein
MDEPDYLAMAARHVAEAKQMIARQRIARLSELGCSTVDAEQTLHVFVTTLEIFQHHERRIRKQAWLPTKHDPPQAPGRPLSLARRLAMVSG